MDRRSLLRLAGLTGAAGLTGLAGCGVASHSGVVVDGPGPSAGTGGSAQKSPPPSRTAKDTPEELVTKFLTQAAGDPANTKAALDRWKNYMTDEFRATWDGESRGVMVVWLKFVKRKEAEGAQGADIKLIYDLVPLGRLDKRGALTPGSEAPARQVTFTVTNKRNDKVPDEQIKPDQTLYIKNIEGAPEGLLLSTAGLATYFEYRNLYFWDRGYRFLIPDGRYVPKEWEWEEPTREKKLVDWLILGPSQWLAGAVQGLPDGTSMPDFPGKVGPNRLALNFTGGNFVDYDLKKLTSQLTWTLLPECQVLGGADPTTSPILIKVDSVEKKTEAVKYSGDNPTVVKVSAPGYQQAFAIDGGRLRRVRIADENSDTPVELLTDEQNRDVEWAAYATERGSATLSRIALVTRDSKGRTALQLGFKHGGNLSSVSKLAGKDMRQPVFVDSDSLLLIADGRLHYVQASSRKASAILNGTGSSVAADGFTVAADGRRIAYIHGGRLNVATLAKADNTYTISVPRTVPVILSNLNGVAFTSERWLAICGIYDDQTRVVEISLDGAMVGDPDRSSEFGWLNGEVATSVVTSLTASLDNPLQAGRSRRIFLTANDRSRDATFNFNPLNDEIIGNPPGKNPTNAFFL